MLAFNLKQTAICTILLTGFLSRLSFAGNPKISSDLQSVHPGETVDVIVEYRTEANSRVPAERLNKLRRIGAVSKGTLASLQSEVISTSGRDLESLADDPDVIAIRPDRRLRSTAFSGSLDYSWVTSGAQAAAAGFGLDGKGIGIAVVDSGVDEHPDLNSAGNRVKFSANFLSERKRRQRRIWSWNTYGGYHRGKREFFANWR